MFMIFFVLHDSCALQEVLDAWEATGVNGITIFPSTGLKRLRSEDVLREDIPLIPSLEDIERQDECLNRTLITIVQDESMIDKIVEATESVVGDLRSPNTGILTVLPVLKAYGLDRKTFFNEDPDH